ncbi:MAG TPA: hypothetical protein VER33_01435 [Polyangiaceae bacterium]|nr:hypothetical protein [Polyangiaceae bacterium]
MTNCCRALALVAVLLAAPPALAAELPGGRLELRRSGAAQGCPDELTLAARVRERARPNAARGLQPVLLNVYMDGDGTAFWAQVKARGRKSGERSLRVEDPSCQALSDALVVTLLVLLDDLPTPRAEPAAAPTEAPRMSTSSSASTAYPVSWWLAAGYALTHGVPERWSLSLSAEILLRLPDLELGLAGFWAPERAIQRAPGVVKVFAAGGRLRVCWLPRVHDTLRVGGCGIGIAAALRGASDDFAVNAIKTRPWWLVGVGPQLRWSLTRGTSVGLLGSVLLPIHDEAFSVQGLEGPVYDSDPVVAWVGADLALKIW